MTIAAPAVSVTATIPRQSGPAITSGPSVGCQFCGEPIEIASFVLASPSQRILSAACSNCGLRVSATLPMVASWHRAQAGPDRASELARRLRARRVAHGTEVILAQARPADRLEAVVTVRPTSYMSSPGV
jgi:hypothetical protein